MSSAAKGDGGGGCAPWPGFAVGVGLMARERRAAFREHSFLEVASVAINLYTGNVAS